MLLLPIDTITYRTRLSQEEVISRLTDSIETEKKVRSIFTSSAITKPYEGQINGNQFTIRRIIRYRNSFLPEINGTVQQGIGETQVRVKMGLHIYTIVFLGLWCSMVGFFCLGSLLRIMNGTKLASSELKPFGMLLFAYVLTMVAFKYESIKSKKQLRTLFEGEITNGK